MQVLRLSAAAAPPHLQLLDCGFSQDTLLVHAFISSRLDYCNSLLVGAADCVIRKLQGVQNAAAWLITGTRKFHITPILRDLHWLQVLLRIKYKIAILVNKCLRGLTPTYLAELCQPVH